MKLEINYNGGVLSIPADIFDDIENLGEPELKVLLYLCSPFCDKNDFKIEAGCTRLGISPSEFESAVSFWRGAGLVKVSGRGSKGGKKTAEGTKNKNQDAPQKEEKTEKDMAACQDGGQANGEIKGNKTVVVTNSPPQYTGKELDRMVSSNISVEHMKKELEAPGMLGRPLRANELNMLVSLFDYFGFDEAYVLQLFANSMDKTSPIKYAYTVGVSYYEKNILTYDQLLEEMARQEEKNSFEQKIKKLFGIDGRTLTAKEKKFFEQWQKYDFELVKHAYEITVDTTGKAAMPYMNRVLVSFEEGGIKTVEQALENTKQYKENKAQQGKGGFDTDEFFKVALESSFRKNNKN